MMERIFSLVISGIAGGLLVLAGNYALKQEAPLQQKEPEALVRPVRNLNIAAGTGVVPFDFTAAAEKAMPVVVHISASQSPKTARRNQPSDPFRLFFGDNWWFGTPSPRSGTGSGVIYSPDGYIVTNNHVVDFADEVLVTLYDNRTYKAEIIGTYPKADLAVLKIDATELETLSHSHSDAAKVGQWVLAVGNPFDLTSTVTAGIISAKARDIDIIKSKDGGRDAIESFIQTDAAVNPGNSGGALVDAQGRLLGINTAISTRTGVFEGYSFAIPIDIVSKIVDDIIRYGAYQRPYLGVNISELDGEYADELGVDITQGVVVESLLDGGSAQFAGMLPKDIILAVGDRPIRSVPELQEVLGQSSVGDILKITVLRRGQEKILSVKLKAG